VGRFPRRRVIKGKKGHVFRRRRENVEERERVREESASEERDPIRP